MLSAEGIPIFSSIPRHHSNLSITPHRPSPSLDTFLRAFLAWGLRHTKFNHDENEPTCSQSPPCHFVIAVYTVTEKGTEPTNETVACLLSCLQCCSSESLHAKKSPRWSQNEISSRCVSTMSHNRVKSSQILKLSLSRT